MEGNPIWSFIAHTLGFAGAVVFRALVGIILLILLLAALRSKRSRVRAFGAFGLYLSAVVLFTLSAYHIWFRLIYG